MDAIHSNAGQKDKNKKLNLIEFQRVIFKLQTIFHKKTCRLTGF